MKSSEVKNSPGRLTLQGGRIWAGSARPGSPPLRWGLEIEGGRILRFVDSHAEVESGGERLDLGGLTVLPGIVDAHVHLLPWARRLGSLDLRECRGWPEVLGQLRLAAAGLAPGEWLFAGGFHPGSLDGTEPTTQLLDEVGHDLPIYVRTHDTHGAWASRAVLRLAGLGPGSPDPPGGQIVRDPSGTPTGLLLENAVGLVRPFLPALGPERERAMLLGGQREAHRLGVTGVHSFEGEDEWKLLEDLHARDELSLRVVHMPPLAEFETHLAAGRRTGQGDEMLRWGCIKMFADGTLGLRTARMLEPYLSGGLGEWNVPPDELRRQAVRAARAGLGVAIHAIGDHGVRACLDALEAARAESAGLPMRIEHVQILSPEDLPRFSRSRIVASMQPCHFTTDRQAAAREWGPRSAFAYAWGRVLGAGAPLVLGTDAPIESMSPWENLAAALGEGREGAPAYDPARPLSLEAALHAMTRSPHEVMGMQGGTLAPGLPADLIVLDVPWEELSDPRAARAARVVLTLSGGAVSHASGPFAGLDSGMAESGGL